MYWHYLYLISFVFYSPLIIHSNNNQVLTVQLASAFNDAVNFALQCSLMRDVVTDLDERIDKASLSCDEVRFLVIARTIVKQRGFCAVATAQKFNENLILQ